MRANKINPARVTQIVNFLTLWKGFLIAIFRSTEMTRNVPSPTPKEQTIIATAILCVVQLFNDKMFTTKKNTYRNRSFFQWKTRERLICSDNERFKNVFVRRQQKISHKATSESSVLDILANFFKYFDKRYHQNLIHEITINETMLFLSFGMISVVLQAKEKE